jgi:hypothetical protein
MAAKKKSKTARGRQKATKVRDLTARNGQDAKAGFGAISSAINQVVKSVGSSLNTAARGG